jgi:hypothetical protein
MLTYSELETKENSFRLDLVSNGAVLLCVFENLKEGVDYLKRESLICIQTFFNVRQQADKNKEIVLEMLYRHNLFSVLAENVFLAPVTLSNYTVYIGLRIVEMILSLEAFSYFGHFDEVYDIFESSGCLCAVESLA